MNKKITAAILLFLCVYLDSIFFARVNVMDIRPDALLAATVSFAVLTGRYSGAVFGAIGGLLLDLLTARYLGLTAALLLVAGLCAGFFYKKFYADNIVVPAGSAVAAFLTKEIFMMLFMFIGGAAIPVQAILLKYMLPSAILTGILCILIHLVLKPVLARQVKRSQAERLSH